MTKHFTAGGYSVDQEGKQKGKRFPEKFVFKNIVFYEMYLALDCYEIRFDFNFT